MHVAAVGDIGKDTDWSDTELILAIVPLVLILTHLVTLLLIQTILVKLPLFVTMSLFCNTVTTGDYVTHSHIVHSGYAFTVSR